MNGAMAEQARLRVMLSPSLGAKRNGRWRPRMKAEGMHRLSPSSTYGVIEIWTCPDCGRSVAITWPKKGSRKFHAEVMFEGASVCLPDGENDYDPETQG